MNRHVTDQLSAYLDGEVWNPDAIRQHLRSCPECSRELEALRGISQAFRELEDPTGNPAFVTRVMASVREQPAPSKRWHVGWRAVAATAAAALLITGAWLNADRFVPSATPPEEPSALEWMAYEPTDSGQDLAAVDYGFPDTLDDRAAPGDLEALDSADWVMALVDDPWFVEVAAAYGDTTSIEEELATLSEEELDNFYFLLASYMTGDEWR